MIKEAAARLSSEDKRHMSRILPEVMMNVLGRNTESEKYIDSFTTTSFSGKEMKIYVYVVEKERVPGGLAYFDIDDENDGFIVFQRENIRRHLNVNNFTVGESTNFLKSVFTHELIHAKDLIIRDSYDDQPYYDPDEEGSYVNAKDEVVAFTSQLYEVVKDMVEDAVYSNNPNDVEETKEFLRELILFYSKLKPLSTKSASHLSAIGNIKTLQFIQVYISQIRTYNKEGYKKLLKNIYDMISKFMKELESI